MNISILFYQSIVLIAILNTENPQKQFVISTNCVKRGRIVIFVPSGDSSGISVTGETPQERGFRDEEAHRTPHRKRPLGTKISADQFFYFIDIKLAKTICN